MRASGMDIPRRPISQRRPGGASRTVASGSERRRRLVSRVRRPGARRAPRDAGDPGCALGGPSLPADRRRSHRARRRAALPVHPNPPELDLPYSASVFFVGRRSSDSGAAFDLLELEEKPNSVYLGDRDTVWFLYGRPDAVRLPRRADVGARGRRAVHPQEARARARAMSRTVRGARAYFLSGEPHGGASWTSSASGSRRRTARARCARWEEQAAPCDSRGTSRRPRRGARRSPCADQRPARG